MDPLAPMRSKGSALLEVLAALGLFLLAVGMSAPALRAGLRFAASVRQDARMRADARRIFSAVEQQFELQDAVWCAPLLAVHRWPAPELRQLNLLPGTDAVTAVELDLSGARSTDCISAPRSSPEAWLAVAANGSRVLHHDEIINTCPIPRLPRPQQSLEHLLQIRSADAPLIRALLIPIVDIKTVFVRADATARLFSHLSAFSQPLARDIAALKIGRQAVLVDVLRKPGATEAKRFRLPFESSRLELPQGCLDVVL